MHLKCSQSLRQHARRGQPGNQALAGRVGTGRAEVGGGDCLMGGVAASLAGIFGDVEQRSRVIVLSRHVFLHPRQRRLLPARPRPWSLLCVLVKMAV